MNHPAEPNKDIVRPARVPTATYRLQFNRDFTFAHASDVADYLGAIGITDCYASPLFQAGPESTHGYDVCRFDRFSAQLGGRDGFDRLSTRLREYQLGLLLDLVPNHMGSDLSNGWWASVLEHGRTSPFAPYFDIHWPSPEPHLNDKVLLPILEDHYAKVLESGKLRLVYQEKRFAVEYHDKRLPLSGASISSLLAEVVAGLPGEERGLASLQEGLERVCHQYNGQPGEPCSFDRLHSLLSRQHYRLASWRVGAEEINYRRFFDVTELVSLRMELPEVFQACHQLVFELIDKGEITGLRVDHPDGLWNPREYFQRLQARGPLYVAAEKILAHDEPLPGDWPVAGTTGYDFLNRATGLFVEGRNEAALTQVYRNFSGNPLDFKETCYLGKRLVLETSLMSELHALTHRLKRVAVRTRYGQDFTFHQLWSALREIIAVFPVYRGYVTENSKEVPPRERAQIEQAVVEAKSREPAMESAAFEFVQDLLLLQIPRDLDENGRRDARAFVLSFQQLTGPVAAKGVEDTACYNYNRLISLNEVGGDAAHFGVTVEAFHRSNQAKAERWPHSMLATATHDTKRGEDVRARINVLSEIPSKWQAAIQRWGQFNAAHRTWVDRQPAPHPNDEYLLYQTLSGTWPFEPWSEGGLEEFGDRIAAYMTKAMREAKARTNWSNPNAGYEAAVTRFVRQILNPAESGRFLEDFTEFQRTVAFFGQFNSLAQLLLKTTSPGVPDFYQGTELWDFSLVDPDNRRPVDYALRRRLLDDLNERVQRGSRDLMPVMRHLLETSGTGQVKLYVTSRSLDFRRRNASLFREGNYLPIWAVGPKRENVCAFARMLKDQVAITVVPRLVAGLTAGATQPPFGARLWDGTDLELPSSTMAGTYRNVFTGEEFPTSRTGNADVLSMGVAMGGFPVALLDRISGSR